ncbi:helix-turn-helix transcriptional regulator [Desulfovibrio sp. ZJ200]|uniref:helix-turn-helix domain-containing protein n=1 Tax=Desulfovibrio sp. ZJ200 TaxID=2709792 RepID=UPI0013ED45EF|nr:helix-turn-helix transcriptional regulator [Desulfovibrio sp. ZJ200]
MTTLGSRIKMARGKESQEKFAARLKISKGALGFYERGENLPKSDVILKICALTGASPDWLLTGAESASREAEHKLAPRLPPANQAEQTAAAAPQESRDCFCPQCADLKKRLTALEEERRDLYAENRGLWKKVCLLLEESVGPRERQP